MRQRAWRVMCWAALLASPFLIVWLIVSYGVNVAVQDQIDIGAFLARNHERLVPRFSDLFTQHNESRKFFPRIVFFYLARLTGWNVKAEMAVTFVVACAVLYTLALLARRSLGDQALPAVALVSILLFSPVQWWNWLFGIQLVVFLPMLMLVIALEVACSGLPPSTRVWIAIACCIVATYSYANGMLIWLIASIALFSRRDTRRPILMGLWLTVAIASVAAYFAGYQRPPDSPLMTLPIARPIDTTAFVLAFIGHPLSWTDRLGTNVLIGAVGFALFLFFAIRVGRPSTPWVLLALYSLLSAGAAATGRLAFGTDVAMEPRYTTFAIPFWVALVILASMSMRHERGVAAIALITVHICAVAAIWPEIRANHRDRLLARAATQFSAVLPDRSLFQRLVYPDPVRGAAIVSDLSRIGYVRPPVVQSGFIRGEVTRGAFEGVMRAGRGFVMYGWAMLPDGRPADAVLITRSEPQGDRVVAISERSILRSDRPGLGWDLPVTQQLAQPGMRYTAWAYDTASGHAYRVAGFVEVGRRR